MRCEGDPDLRKAVDGLEIEAEARRPEALR